MASSQGSNVPDSPAGDDVVEDAELREQPDENQGAERNADDGEQTPSPEPQDAPPADNADAEVPEAGDEPVDPPQAGTAKPTTEKRKPSPVDEAIAKMTAPPATGDADGEPGGGKPTDTTAPKATAKPAEPAKPATSNGQPTDDSDPKPSSEWSPEERKHTKGRVKQRYDKLYESHQQSKPFVEIGQEWSGFVNRQKLTDDLNAIGDNEQALSVAIRTQAAALRVAQAAREGRAVPDADVAWLKRNREAIDQVLGVAGQRVEAPPEDLSKVEVSEQVRDLEALGLLKGDDELRAVQAAIDRVRGKKPAATAPVKEQPRAAAPAAPPAKPAEPSVPWTTEDVELSKAAIREDLLGAGVKPDQLKAHFAANLTPLITARMQALMPGKNPDAAWARLSPVNRRELVKQAQSAWQAKQPPPTKPAPRRAPNPAPVQGTGSGGVRRPLVAHAANGKGVVDATIDSLTGSESD